MSAPLTVNTRDGVCWTRRTVTSSGIALYAPEGVCKCPEFVMATLAELAEHGITGSADVLPVPVGPEPQTARQKVDEAFGIEARLFQHALDKVFSVLAEGGFLAAPSQTAALRARIAELEAERHETNEALDDAVRELRARQSCPCPPEGRPHQVGCPQAEVPPSERPVNGLTATFMPVASLRAQLEDPHDGPLAHRYLVPRDLPVPDTCRLSADELDEVSRDAWFGGGAR